MRLQRINESDLFAHRTFPELDKRPDVGASHVGTNYTPPVPIGPAPQAVGQTRVDDCDTFLEGTDSTVAASQLGPGSPFSLA
jgi:hypothetical protein